jgi:hypothetical protein
MFSPASLRTAACVFADKRKPRRSRNAWTGSSRAIRPSTFARKRIPIVPVKVSFSASACKRASRSSRITTAFGTCSLWGEHFFLPCPQNRLQWPPYPVLPEIESSSMEACRYLASRCRLPCLTPIPARRRAEQACRCKTRSINGGNRSGASTELAKYHRRPHAFLRSWLNSSSVRSNVVTP